MSDQDDHQAPEEGGEDHLPTPTAWPIGFAIGVALVLVGLIVSPVWVTTVGAVIAIVFGFLWARDAMRAHAAPAHVEAERRGADAAEPAVAGAVAGPASTPAHELSADERFPRNTFLAGSTLALGAVIGGIVAVPVTGFAVLPGFVGQKRRDVDIGPVDTFKEGQWYVTTFESDPAQGEVSRRTAFVRNNGLLEVEGKAVPSFTIISNHCVHLGCPVQANGPTGAILGQPDIVQHTKNGKVTLSPTVPAGFGCPCHGGQYDTEGNRTAGPPVRALDRYDYAVRDGRIVLLSVFSVGSVDGTGAQAEIHKYKAVGPGIHVDGVEQVLYPLNPPMH